MQWNAHNARIDTISIFAFWIFGCCVTCGSCVSGVCCVALCVQCVRCVHACVLFLRLLRRLLQKVRCVASLALRLMEIAAYACDAVNDSAGGVCRGRGQWRHGHRLTSHAAQSADARSTVAAAAAATAAALRRRRRWLVAVSRQPARLKLSRFSSSPRVTRTLELSRALF